MIATSITTTTIIIKSAIALKLNKTLGSFGRGSSPGRVERVLARTAGGGGREGAAVNARIVPALFVSTVMTCWKRERRKKRRHTATRKGRPQEEMCFLSAEGVKWGLVALEPGPASLRTGSHKMVLHSRQQQADGNRVQMRKQARRRHTARTWRDHPAGSSSACPFPGLRPTLAEAWGLVCNHRSQTLRRLCSGASNTHRFGHLTLSLCLQSRETDHLHRASRGHSPVTIKLGPEEERRGATL
ncbi:uncharacterized protein LOC125107008 [Lutra lutra]|uniref:uncharacterized protein LOC125107008 n=1 Tax=Lutra lutra TaxID=9657 RepID=UPI001FD07F97|nr:uncharacterized protein LOC125107008 [Lutra lutra]